MAHTRQNKSTCGKPSVRSRQRRREFLKQKNGEVQRRLQTQLEKEDHVIKELQQQLEISERVKAEALEKLNNEWKEKVRTRDKEWESCLREQDMEWKKGWALRLENLQRKHREEVEGAKQGLLEDRVQLLEDKRNAERNRDLALARVEDLEREVANLNSRLARRNFH